MGYGEGLVSPLVGETDFSSVARKNQRGGSKGSAFSWVKSRLNFDELGLPSLKFLRLKALKFSSLPAGETVQYLWLTEFEKFLWALKPGGVSQIIPNNSSRIHPCHLIL